MPYIDFESSDDYASLWYITNTHYGNVTGFRKDLPLLFFLHAQYLDSSWLHNQFGDPRLSSAFNMIALDARVCGKSSSRPSGKHDSFVEAADLAKVHQLLQLPPCHVVAFESLGCTCAIRFAALFPELCTSLILCNPPPPTELKWAFNTWDEVLRAWGYAEDLDTFERFGLEAANVVLGGDPNPDLQEELITYWAMELPPRRRQRIVEQVNVLLNRSPLLPQFLAGIQQPVLILHGEQNALSPIKYAEALAKELINSENVILYPIKGAGENFGIFSSKTSIAHQVMAKFIIQLQHFPTEIKPPTVPLRTTMARALRRLADYTGDPSISERDPLSSLSFCCLSAKAIADQTESLKTFGKGQLKAFNPLGPHGRPIRSPIARKHEHWFHGGDDMLSISSSIQASKSKSERPLPTTVTSDPITAQVAEDGRVRRANMGRGTDIVVEQIIKGSMVKIVAGTTPINNFKVLK